MSEEPLPSTTALDTTVGGSGPNSGKNEGTPVVDRTVPGRHPEGGASVSFPSPDSEMADFIRQMRDDFTRMLMEYQFAIDEVLTKVTILREEFTYLQKYNPIEHVTSRIKSAESILNKMHRRGVPPTVEAIRLNIRDVAGIRITCSFIADTYRMLEALTSQDDIIVLEVKDYIAHPKPNGYKSLHAIVEIPVFLSTGPIHIPVEIQIRTIAMDFWAALEHKIFYKYEGAVPEHLAADLTEAALAAENLDRRMEQLHHEVHGADTVSVERKEPVVNEGLLREFWQRVQAQ